MRRRRKKNSSDLINVWYSADGKRLYWQRRVKMTHQRWPCLNEDESFTVWYYCVGKKKIHIKTTRETLQCWYHREEMTQRERSSGQLRLFLPETLTSEGLLERLEEKKKAFMTVLNNNSLFRSDCFFQNVHIYVEVCICPWFFFKNPSLIDR